jgi:hypothetical protein
MQGVDRRAQQSGNVGEYTGNDCFGLPAKLGPPIGLDRPALFDIAS